MARTYDLYCKDCHKAIWVGQQHADNPGRVYTDEKHAKSLRDFLFSHVGHRLVFQETGFLDGEVDEKFWDKDLQWEDDTDEDD